MSLELNDWVSYCKGNKYFDKSHFYTLLMSDDDQQGISEHDYRTIFEYFDHSNELITRLRDYHSAASQNINEKTKEYLIEKVGNDLVQKSTAIDDMEILSILKNEIKFIDDFNSVETAQLGEWHGEFTSLIMDYILDEEGPKDAKTSSLFEAYYGLTHNYHLVWYLGSPLLNISIDFDYYFDIWKASGDYAITESGVITSYR